MEYYKVRKKDVHIIIIDLNKAYDQVLTERNWWVMIKEKSYNCIRIVQDMLQRNSNKLKH